MMRVSGVQGWRCRPVEVLALAALLSALGACTPKPKMMTAVPAATKAPKPLALEVRGPTVVIFVPDIPDAERSTPGIEAAYAHTDYAAEDLVDCLGPRGIVLQAIHGNTVLLSDAGKRSEHPVARTPWMVGCVLAAPGRTPVVIHSEVGPSALALVCSNAATAFFGIPPCDKWSENLPR